MSVWTRFKLLMASANGSPSTGTKRTFVPACWCLKAPLPISPMSVLHTKTFALDVIDLDLPLGSHSYLEPDFFDLILSYHTPLLGPTVISVIKSEFSTCGDSLDLGPR